MRESVAPIRSSLSRALRLGILLVSILVVVEAVSRLLETPDAPWHAWMLASGSVGTIGAAFAILRPRPTALRWFELRAGTLASIGAGVGVVLLLARLPPTMGSGPAGPPIDRAAFASSWSDRPVVLLALGDSVSTGYGAPEGNGYFALLAENDDERHPDLVGCDLRSVLPSLRVRCLARNSANSRATLRTLQGIDAYSDDVFGIVCLSTGGIDLLHDYGRSPPSECAMYGATLEEARPWIASFRQRLDASVAQLHRQFPGGCAVFVATIYDPTDGVGDVEHLGPWFWLPPWDDGLELLDAYDREIESLAARDTSVHLADVRSALLGHGIHCRDSENPYYEAEDPHYWYDWNLEDPNARGHDAIRRVFLNAIVDGMRGAEGFTVAR